MLQFLFLDTLLKKKIIFLERKSEQILQNPGTLIVLGLQIFYTYLHKKSIIGDANEILRLRTKF